MGGKQTRAKDFESLMNKKVGFDATSPRFTYNQIFYGQKLPFTPGPGQYDQRRKRTLKGRPNTFSQPRNKNLKFAVVFNSCEKKFKGGNNSYVANKGTAKNIGPGSYYSGPEGNSMIKKSFNMSMEHSYFV